MKDTIRKGVITETKAILKFLELNYNVFTPHGDGSKYLLGIDKDGTGKRILECFEAAKERHLNLLQNASDEMAQAICAFFRKWNPEKAKENPGVMEKWEDITDSGNLIFCMI